MLDFLYGKHTFVNPVLARHYGMPEPAAGRRLGRASTMREQYGRGGLLPMAVFLTKNAPGLRTSPVKRGYWVVRRLLGEHIPPPPPNVPELPDDEAKLGDLTLRETLAQHRANPSCAGCHARFDSFGLVFEGYGPVGETPRSDLGGPPGRDRAPRSPAAARGPGSTGCARIMRARSGRTISSTTCAASCWPMPWAAACCCRTSRLLDDMRKQLAADGYRFGSLVEDIVTSPQFLNKRGDDDQSEGSR